MPRFQVEAIVETHYFEEVDAPSAPEAATKVGDQIRAGTAEAVHGPTIAHVNVKTLYPEDDQ